MWGRHHGGVPVGVIDVGSNTVRLLVVRGGRPVLSEREMLRLGADVERDGRISDQKLAQAAEVVAGYAEDARSAGVEELEVLITSPGRQAANGDELLEVLALAARCPVRVLSSAEEGRLAFVGAVGLATPPPRRTVAVVDVGGGSAQVVVGTRRDGPSWQQSIDLGSQRLTSRLLPDEPPGEWAVRRASAEVARYLTGLVPPDAAHGLRGRRQRPCAEADRRPASRSRRACVPARSRRLDAGHGARRALRHRRRADANGRRRDDHPRRLPAVARRAAEGRARWAPRRCGRRAG